MRRFGRKGRRSDKAAPKVFDPSALLGDVKMDNKDIEIFLVKMPEQLASQFDDPSRGIVGRLRIADETKPTGTKPSETKPTESGGEIKPKKEQLSEIFIDKIVQSGKEAESISKQYQLHMLQGKETKSNIFVFSHTPAGETDDSRVEGTVSFQCQARPAMNEAFRKMNNHRSYALNKSKSKMMTLTESDRKAADLKALRPLSLIETTKEREERKRQKEQSRRHLDVPDEEWVENTKTHIFHAFEIQAYYTADDLAKTLGETTSRLRPLISDLCLYNKSAPFTGKYELKDEYKTVEQRRKKEEAIAEHQQNQQELVKKRKEERLEREKTEGPQSKKQRM